MSDELDAIMSDDHIDVPEDIQKAAHRIARQGIYNGGVEWLAGDIAKALMVERERCARIADDNDGVFSAWGNARSSEIAWRVCADIAAAIRDSSPAKEGSR